MGAEDPSRASPAAPPERLNRYLARSGVASRRAADQLIASGAVRVNGQRPPAAGLLIDPARDRVTVHGRAVKPAASHRYVLLNKPLGAITTARDEAARTTVLDVIGEAGSSGHRLFPVGRLDADSTGLLLLTDDGELAYRLTHPRYKVTKEYEVTVAGMPAASDLDALRRGVELDDGMTAPADVQLLRASRGARDSARAELRVVIGEGRNRQVRRMLQAVGQKVVALRRTAFGPLRIGRLKTGAWRLLTEAEVAALRRATGWDATENPRREIRRSRWPGSGRSDEQRSERITSRGPRAVVARGVTTAQELSPETGRIGRRRSVEGFSGRVPE